MQITISKNGPYLVSGSIPLFLGKIETDANGASLNLKEIKSIEAPESYALCRCGHSANKPFCDGSHMKVGFEGDTTAPHTTHAQQSKCYSGPSVSFYDAEELCVTARFCDRGLNAWTYTQKSDDPKNKEEAVREACLCPSGRLVICDEKGDPLETNYEPSIMVLEDPSRKMSSAYFVRGGIPVIDEAGNAYEARNRQMICRCGGSRNKPFCDATHYQLGFVDGIADS